jgi:hypothetical protein
MPDPSVGPQDRLQITLNRDDARRLLGNALLPARERMDPLKAPETAALLDWMIHAVREWLDMPPGYAKKARP